MTIRDRKTHYGAVAKLLHWGMALLVIGMLIVGLIMTEMTLSPEKLQLYGWHKSVGAIILGLAAFRLVWRLTNPPTLLSGALPRMMRMAAHLTHLLLYVLLFVMPISGWLMSSASGFSVSVFGLFTLPDLVEAGPRMKYVTGEVHEYAAFTLIALICLHAGAALLHHFILRDDTLRRMLPFAGYEK